MQDMYSLALSSFVTGLLVASLPDAKGLMFLIGCVLLAANGVCAVAQLWMLA